MRRAPVLLAAVLVAGLVAAAPVTLARFTVTGETDASFTTGSILPPTSLAASVSGPVVTLTWTPSTSSAVQGYEVLRSSTSGSGFSVIASVTPRSATTTTNSPGNGAWYYALRATLERWNSVASNEVHAAVASGSTGFKPCTTNAADTGGDNNGYELAPANACDVDGAVATDAGSGTDNVVSCTDAGKDSHRFGGYSFGLPGTVTAVRGIELRLVAGMNNNGGTTNICAQLSWDGGVTWTATRQVTLSGAALATYEVGGMTDTWGRTWTAAQLASGTFVVRLINASSQPNKDLRLDGVSVQVHYTP